MPTRTILVATAMLIAASPVFAQQNPDQRPRPPTVTAERVDDEPNPARSSPEEVYVTGSRQIPVERIDGARSFEQRQRDRAEGRCVLQAQESADPMEPHFGLPETVCREP
jgi:hypothetical protein